MLPDKPSELIRLALSDLEKAEKAKDVFIDMGFWISRKTSIGVVEGEQKVVCFVCLAGAVMINTLQVKPSNNHQIYPTNDQFDTDTHNKLSAINDFRIGDWGDGLDRFNTFPDDFSDKKRETLIKKLCETPVTDYATYPDDFKTGLLKAADLMEKAGL